MREHFQRQPDSVNQPRLIPDSQIPLGHTPYIEGFQLPEGGGKAESIESTVPATQLSAADIERRAQKPGASLDDINALARMFAQAQHAEQPQHKVYVHRH